MEILKALSTQVDGYWAQIIYFTIFTNYFDKYEYRY